MKFIPHDYQKQVIDFVVNNNYCGLFLDMSLGKTVISLTAIKQLKELGEVKKVLVIAPRRVAESTWVSEHEKWDHLESLKIVQVMGTPKKRLNALKEDGDIYIVTRDNIKWLVELLGRHWDFDMVVIDELSSFKSSTSQRFKKLKIVRPFIKRLIGLTGTPAPNGYEDLWSQIYLLDQGERLGKNITQFRNRYFNQFLMGNFRKYTIRDGSKEEIDEAIKDICISMKARDYLDLKEPMYIDRVTKLSDKDFKTYQTMQKDMVLEFGEDDITALNASAVSNKLSQLANGAIYKEDGEVMEVHDNKLDVLEELIDEANGEPILMFYNFKHDRDRILKKFGKKVKLLETDKDIKDWNNKKIKVLLTHPASAGHGLNLQDGGSIVVWFGLNWSLELYQQANARLHRQGQSEAVRIYHIVTEKTIDEKILEVLEGKNIRQEDLLRQLKAEVTK